MHSLSPGLPENHTHFSSSSSGLPLGLPVACTTPASTPGAGVAFPKITRGLSLLQLQLQLACQVSPKVTCPQDFPQPVLTSAPAPGPSESYP